MNFNYHLLVLINKTWELGDAGTSRALVPLPGKDFMKVLIGYPATFLARQYKHIYTYMYVTSHCHISVGEIFNMLM